MSSSAFSQIVRGTIVDESTNAPLPGVFVVLLDSVGRMRGGTLTDQKGFYAIRAPYQGPFTLRAERIGHRSTTTAPIALSEAQAQSMDMRVPVAPIALAPIDVNATRRCELAGEQARRTAQLWEEARKALTVTQWVKAERPVRFEWRTYTRELAPYSLEVRTESTKYGSSSVIPYKAVSPDSLSRFGFVQNSGADLFYYGPDADVLLSDIFLEQHCFRTVAGSGGTEGMVGLAFEPVRDREVRDINGTLWLDAKTLELRFIEYRYTNMPRTYNIKTLGGRTDFRRLSNGAWIVEEWYIRMPMEMLSAKRDVLLRALKEEGGQVLSVSDDQASVAITNDGAVRGTVFDSVRGQPLANATVYLSGTSYRAVTDTNGNYMIQQVPEGNYVIAFTHPVLDSLPAFPLPKSVAVARKDTTQSVLAIGTVATQMREKCGAADTNLAAGKKTAGTLFGYVHDNQGQGVANAEVVAAHKSLERATTPRPRLVEERQITSTRTDRSGRYELCKLPLSELLTVTVEYQERKSEPVEIRIDGQPFKRVDLVAK
ncbi:MAG TPA: carboxypeptidase regulatory-like domain-containing protein [Longimicrobiales bacterium]